MTRLLPFAAAALALTACSTIPSGPPTTVSVANTSWRVAGVNGRPTPPGPNFNMSFDSVRMSAKFGCNGMGADYLERGAIIDLGPVIGTKMACPDMSYEIDAGRVLSTDVEKRWTSPVSLRLVSPGGSIDLVR